jgi:hypothetical protein
MKTQKLRYRLLSAALTATMVFAMTPFVPPSAPANGADPPAARTVFLNIGPGGFNEGNTSL